MGFKLELAKFRLGWPFPKFLCYVYPIVSFSTAIVGQRLCGKRGVPIPSLQVLPCYRRWPGQALYPILLGLLGSVTHIDSWVLPLLYIFSLTQRWPYELILVFSFPIIYNHPLCLMLLFPQPPPINHTLFCCRFYFSFTERFMSLHTLTPPLLLGFSRSVDCSMVILYS